MSNYSIISGGKYFSLNGLENYFAFQLVIKYFKPLANNIVKAWKSKCLSDESIKLPVTSDNSLNPMLDYFNSLEFGVKFNGSCLKTDETGFNHKKKNLHIIYEIIS